MSKQAHFRFYEELNDFLPPERRKREFSYNFTGKPTVKDAVESLGVPHAEIDLIIVNGEPEGFDHHLKEGDQVSVYPVFESFDISPVNRLRPEPLRDPKFILDVHLGKLAQYLRMLGFDTLFSNSYEDPEIVRTAVRQKRIILTRDVNLLKHNAVTHGYWVRSTDPDEQIVEIIGRFDLSGRIAPFTRCMVCNGIVSPAAKESVRHLLEESTARYYDEFFQCGSCEKVYWRGSHHENMERFIAEVMERLARKA
ncbi:Mut7-C RNAse domain-containing protein [candidate division KSB1 bacterium]